MTRSICWGLSLLLVVFTTARAESILDDQFIMYDPDLSVSVLEDRGTAPCILETAGFDSFVCGPQQLPGSIRPYMGGGSDALGTFYRIRFKRVPAAPTWCENEPGISEVYDIERITPVATEVVARVPSCVRLDPPRPDPCCQNTRVFNLAVDAANGVIYMGTQSWISGSPNLGIVTIQGLPNLLDIILSYQPPSTLSFNVPVRPEGLAGSDSFSLYHGDVRNAGSLSSAVPLDCLVPDDRTPIPGEILTVPDTTPTPAAGEIAYFLVAANHQGQRRAGRQSAGGVLQGRDASQLPACK